jgi:hypothetical protein
VEQNWLKRAVASLRWKFSSLVATEKIVLLLDKNRSIGLKMSSLIPPYCQGGCGERRRQVAVAWSGGALLRHSFLNSCLALSDTTRQTTSKRI